MFNKRVYLAKSNLASGFDFEYVKSNLLRIPDIEIIEYGDGVDPSECTCIVYVPEPQDGSSDTIDVSKNVARAMLDYLEAESGDTDIVLIYQTANHSNESQDVESSTPVCFLLEEIELTDNESWESYATAKMHVGEFNSLCATVSDIIGSGNSWVKNSRHYIPKKGFRLPPIPPIEKRRSKGTKGHYSSDENTSNKRGFSETLEKFSVKPREEYIPSEGERERYSNLKSKRKERLL